LTYSISAQEFSAEALSKMEDEALLTLFNNVEFDSIRAEKVARTYLDRARKEQDTIKMARGYDRLARIFHPQKNIQFADSIIYLTNNIKNITYPGIGYILKATEYYLEGELEFAFNNYIKAYKIAVKNNNIAHQVYLSDVLIYIKIFWGNKRAALVLQKKRHKLITEIDYYDELKKSRRKGADINLNDLYLENELYSISNFVLCYIELKLLDSAQYYLDIGYKKIKKYNGTPNVKYKYEIIFPTSHAEINYYKKNYRASLDTINDLLSSFKLETIGGNKHFKSIYLFKGLNLYELNNKKEGVTYLLKADSILNKNKSSLVPYHRMIYEKLLDYYTNENIDLNKRLKCLNKLIEVDSIIIKNYQFFEPTLIKEFENPELFKEKEKIIEELKFDNIKSKSIIWIVLGVLSTCILILILYYKRQQTYKVRHKELMHLVNKAKSISQLKVPRDIFNDILDKLETFERKKGYLKSDITINQLAKTFGTNHKYLSKVINIEKDNNFSQYLNDLRITYAFTELQMNDKLRSFTIVAIAKENGFKNAESFSKAFYKKYKIKPSFYLKQLSRG
jgi:AraC-like DNA-binding protein